jgi:hypothetical protein
MCCIDRLRPPPKADIRLTVECRSLSFNLLVYRGSTIQRTIEQDIKSLSFGIMQNSPEQIYQAHRNLYERGNEVLPALEELLLNKAWQDVKHGPQIVYLTGVLNVIHDINENHAKEVVAKIKQAGASVIVDRRISAITNFTVKNFCVSEISNVKVFVSKKLKNHSQIRRKFDDWFNNVPPDDIGGLSRLYIVPSYYNYGDYTPILCKLVIGWDTSISYINPFSWLWLFSTERTFYKEIGHHAFKHSFEKDVDEKSEADRYSYELMCKSRPIFMAVVGWFIRLFRKLRKNTKAS